MEFGLFLQQNVRSGCKLLSLQALREAALSPIPRISRFISLDLSTWEDISHHILLKFSCHFSITSNALFNLFYSPIVLKKLLIIYIYLQSQFLNSYIHNTKILLIAPFKHITSGAIFVYQVSIPYTTVQNFIVMMSCSPYILINYSLEDKFILLFAFK